MTALDRRQVLKRGAAMAAGAVAARSAGPGDASAAQTPGRVVTRGRLTQSVSRWCYAKIPLPEFCRDVAAMGLTAIDLLEPEDWPVVREHGLVCSMGYGGGGTIEDGLNWQGDRTAFGVEVVAAVNSPRVKLLYDAYHMQIMEGDVIRTIRQHHAHIAHYHTGGVPGRHELDDTQELQWAAVCRAIVDTGFTGYLAHEFVPTRDPLTSLRDAVALCDV
ncbi:MAG: TIM barrel protein [Vicinamibacterales bacterium]